MVNVTVLALVDDVRAGSAGTMSAISETVDQPIGFGTGMGAPWRRIDPAMAAALAAVLRAAAEQVNREKLLTFQVASPYDLTLLGLAMAFRSDDTGILGDTFEWAVLAAINYRDPIVMTLIDDAFAVLRETLPPEPQAVIAAVENNRAAYYLPNLPADAVYRTGRRGRPPHLLPLLDRVTTIDWKSDVLIGADRNWVGATVKSNPADMRRHLLKAAQTTYPPRLGITAVHPAAIGVHRDPATGIPVVKVPADTLLMSLLRATIADVKSAFATHLNPPVTPLAVSGTARLLNERKHDKVGDLIAELEDRARHTLLVSSSEPTETNLAERPDALIALNPLVDPTSESATRRLDRPGQRERERADRLTKFGTL